MNIKLLQNNFKFLNELITLNNGFNRTLALLLLFLCFGVNEVEGQTATITITNSSIGGSSILGSNNYNSGAERTWTQNSVSFGGKAITCNPANTPTTGVTSCDYIQAQGSNGVIYNTTAFPGRIVSIQFTGTASVASSCFGGTSRLVNSTSGNYTVSGGTQIGSAQTSANYTWTTQASDNFTFFCIQRGSTAQYFSSIVITYQTTSPPTLTAASSPTVDGAFNVTFTDSSAWRSAITSITVGGTTLSNTAYTISAGQITFTPSASTLLQSSGSKSIAVIATNYSNATVTQSIGAGAATKLAITTQPTAPTINGGALAAQPVVVIQDQYSNTTTSTASVAAAVGSGTWTIGGTTSKAGVSGTATFTDLTATSAAAVTGATITFTSGSLTSVTSGTFNIPVPAPSNNLCSNPSAININGGTVSGTTIAATYTTLTSEPYTTYSDVWYSFTPSNSGNVTVSTATTNTDYDLYAFTSCPSSATSYVTGGNAATGSTTSESITFAVTLGTTYIIRVVNTTSSAGSTFTIQATQPIPTISSTGTLAAINTNYGTASSNTSFSVSGSNLAAGISINPPAGFQVSTSSTFASNIGTNGSPITLSPTSGTVSATTIYVRIPSTTAVGSYSGNIALTSTGATTVNVATVSSTVSAIAPTFGTFSAITKNFGDADFTITAPTSNSSGAITFTSSNTSVATINGSTVTIVGAGTSTITATQAANGNYTSGTTTATLTVNSIAPTIGTLSDISKNYGDAPFTLTAPTSNSSGAFSYISSNTSVATINGSTVTIVGAGTSTITATQAANGNYTSGTTTATLTVNSIAPTIGTLSDISKNYGDAPFTLTAPTSNSSGAFSYISSNTSVATINGSTVTIVGAGTSTITATQAANGNYSSGTTTATLTVNTSAPTFGTFSAITKNFGDADFTLTAPISNSSGAITFTSSNTSVATISGSTITIVGAGTSTITATQAANGNYTSGTTTATLTVNTIAPTIGTFSAITKNFGDADFTLTAPISNSSGAITFTSSNTSVATISGSTITIVGAGTSTITATQAANGNYTSGTTTATLTVNTIAPTIGTFSAITKNFGDADFTLTAPISNSSGAITFTSSNTSVATISGSTVTIVGAGTSTITATQAANGNYSSGSTSATLTVNSNAPTFGTFSAITKNFGDADFTLTVPTSNSSGAITFTSSNTSVATISGSTVTIVGAGTSTITATQAANSNYSSGSTTATLTVNRISPTIGSLSSITKNYGDTAFSITDPSSNSTGAFSYSSSDTSVATISGSTVTIVGAGTATITATQAATSNYTSGSTSTTLTVNTISPTLGAFNSITKTIGDAAFSISDPSSNSSGAFSFTSSNTSVATISGSTVTLVGVGVATITATQAATSNFTSGSTSTTLTVITISPTIGTLNSITKTIGDANFSLSAPSSNSSGAFSYSSSDTSVATISGSTVTLVGIGTATITATQAANGNYSSGSTTATLTVNPVVPIISTTGTLNAFTSCSGFVSAEQSFSVSGVNLSSNITVTAPSGYELSLTSGGSFGNSVTLTQSAATVATTTVYVRLKNNASNGASGNIVCSSTNATSVNVSTGSATIGNPTVTNSNALNFDGINDKVTLNSNLLPATTELTYELWMKPNATSGVLLAHESWNTGYIHFQFHGSKIGFDVNGGNDNIFNYVFSSNTWYHIAAVYSSTAHTLKFYVNGVLQSTVVNNSFPSVVGNVPITIGSWNNDRYFSGNMDDIRIWNVARTDSQIQSAMNSELTGNESGLVAYFNFNQGTANGNNTAITSLTDNSGNNNSGSFSNMALTGTTSNFVLGVLSNNSISTSGQTVCANSTATALTSNLNGVSGLTFQWYSNSTSSNSGGTLIANATSSSFTPPTNSVGTKYYYLVVTNAYGCVSSSNVSGAITVNPTPTIALASSATSAIYNANSQTTSISYSGTTGNPTDYSITWNSSPSNSFMAVANANLPSSPISISVPAGANTGTYSGTLTVNNSSNCTSANNNFTFTIALNNGDTTPPTITHPVSQNSANAKSIKISENTAGITTYTANENVTWSISGGSESNLFNINPSTGLLTFINPPIYANPTDTAPTNSYVVEITATDGSANVSRQLLTVFISPFCGNWGN
jgi:hypothetical protein